MATESPSHYDHLEHMSVSALLQHINREDHRVPEAVHQTLPQLEPLVAVIVEKMKAGGRLFYIGAGTSGRLGILDASEIPPTYGMPHNRVIGLIAGGDKAIRKAVEKAEDNERGAWQDMSAYGVSTADVVIGIAASGRTPYVIGGLDDARSNGVTTGCITCNKNTRLAALADYPVEVIVGPEFVTGSTRMKAGTAQKLVLNMISTAVMIQLGRVSGNKMVDMMLSNQKLVNRGTRMIMEELGVEEKEAARLLNTYKNVRVVLEKKR